MFKNIFKDIDLIEFILKKGGVIFLFRIFSMFITFFITWFITNQYGEANFGRYSLAVTILQIFYLFFAFGLPHAFIAFTGGFANNNLIKGFLLKTIKISMLASIVPFLILIFGSEFISTKIFEKPSLLIYINIISFSVPILILHELICYYFLSLEKNLIYGLILFVFPNVLTVSFLLLFQYFELPDWHTFLSYILGIFVTVLFSLIFIFFNKPKITKPKLKTREILKKSTPMMFGTMFLLLLNWTDILILGKLETEEKLGIYNAAFKVGYLTLFFVSSMNVVVTSKISYFFHQNMFVEMKKIINRTTQIIIILTLPFTCTLILFSEYILSFFGEGIKEGSVSLIIIAIGGLFNAMTGNVDQILNMTGHQKTVRNVMFIGFIVNVVLNLILIPLYGINGAAISSLIVNIIVNSIFVFAIKKKLGFYTFI